METFRDHQMCSWITDEPRGDSMAQKLRCSNSDILVRNELNHSHAVHETSPSILSTGRILSTTISHSSLNSEISYSHRKLTTVPLIELESTKGAMGTRWSLFQDTAQTYSPTQKTSAEIWLISLLRVDFGSLRSVLIFEYYH